MKGVKVGRWTLLLCYFLLGALRATDCSDDGMNVGRQHSELFVAFCQCPHVKSKIYLGIRTCYALGKSPGMITGQAWVGKGKKLKKVESKWCIAED